MELSLVNSVDHSFSEPDPDHDDHWVYAPRQPDTEDDMCFFNVEVAIMRYEVQEGQEYDPSDYDYRKYGDRPPTLALQYEHERRIDDLLAHGQTLPGPMWGTRLLEVLAAEDAQVEVAAEHEYIRQYRCNMARVPYVPHTAPCLMID